MGDHEIQNPAMREVVERLEAALKESESLDRRRLELMFDAIEAYERADEESKNAVKTYLVEKYKDK